MAIEQAWAYVTSAGSVAWGRRVTSCSHPSTGIYTLTLSEDLGVGNTNFGALAIPGPINGDSGVHADVIQLSDTTATVRITDAATAALTDHPFNFFITDVSP